jgi:hypothetical protein
MLEGLIEEGEAKLAEAKRNVDTVTDYQDNSHYRICSIEHHHETEEAWSWRILALDFRRAQGGHAILRREGRNHGHQSARKLADGTGSTAPKAERHPRRSKPRSRE